MDAGTVCPTLEDLWPAAVGEQVDAQVGEHLAWCEECATRVAQLTQEINAARDLCQIADCADPDEMAAAHTALSPHVASSRLDDSTLNTVGESRPETIGKYLIIDTIGEGGQATVYRGVHPSLRIDVAIKWSHRRSLPDERERARLVSEARLLAELDHPHLARVYDLDFCDDRPFLVMDYIRGEHLRAYRARKVVAEPVIMRIVAVIARAVAAAHELGILHLDLKPENILIDRDGQPVLLDFGLSFLSRIETGRPCGGVLFAGTPQYMAPEQTRGTIDDLSPQTDVFGLGAVLFFLCTGNDPRIGESPQVPIARQSEAAEPLLDQSGASRRLKRICRRAMAPGSEARFAGASELADALDHERKRRAWIGRWKRRTLAVMTATLGFLLIAGAWTLGNPPSPDEAPTMDIFIRRDGHELTLANALPLLVGDRLRLRASIPQTHHVALVAMSPGQPPVLCQPIDVTPDAYGHGAIVSFPSKQPFINYESAKHPLALVLLMRKDRPIRGSDLAGLAGMPVVPAFPPHVAVHFSSAGATTVGHPQTAAPTEITQWCAVVQNHMAAKVTDICGVVLPAAQPVERDESGQSSDTLVTDH